MAVDPSMIQVADIVEGVTTVDDRMTAMGKIPDTLLAPGWSHNTVVAAVMALSQFHTSTQLAGLMSKVDTDNRGVP